MPARLIAILIAVAIAFITVAISIRIQPLRKLMFDGYLGAPNALRKGT
jgi:hypothetical protein